MSSSAPEPLPPGVAEGLADLLRPRPDRLRTGQGVQVREVDRDRQGRRPRGVHGPAGARAGDPDGVAAGGQPRESAAGAQEVAGVARALEAEEVGPGEPAQDVDAPGELREQLDGQAGCPPPPGACGNETSPNQE